MQYAGQTTKQHGGIETGGQETLCHSWKADSSQQFK